MLTALRRVRADDGRVSFENYRTVGWSSPADAARAFAAACATADIVLASRADEELLHGPETSQATIHRLALGGPAEVVLRAGADGAHVRAGGEIVHVPAPRVDRIIDTTAAFDASSGAYLAARLAGHEPVAATRLADAMVARVIDIAEH